VVLPTLISIDTSIFGSLAKDYFSRNVQICDKAKKTIACMNENGMIPFFSFHHIQEILQHDDDRVVFERWSLINMFPQIAWMCSYSDENVLGSVFDVHLIEVKYLLDNPQSGSGEFKNEVVGKYIKYSDGKDFTARFELVYAQVRDYGLVNTQKSKVIESLSHVQDREINETKLSILFETQLRNPAFLNSHITKFEGQLVESLELKGDEKLIDISETAKSFVSEVIADSKLLYAADSSLFEAFVNNAGVRMDQVTPKTTVGQLGSLAVYNKRIRQILESLCMPKDREIDIPYDKQIVWIIQEYLDTAMMYEKRAHGSNMQDRHMAIFSIFVDIFTADKRVTEYFRQLSRKRPDLKRVFGDIVKLSSYSNLNKLTGHPL
jgi:hypothetical protein